MRAQLPFEQTEPLGQLTHWFPNAPHAIDELPVWQTPPRQQPAQFAGEHEGVQVPFTQFEPLGQVTHWLPNAPQALNDVPPRQTPF